MSVILANSIGKYAPQKAEAVPALSPGSVNIWNMTYLIDYFEVLRTNSYL